MSISRRSFVLSTWAAVLSLALLCSAGAMGQDWPPENLADESKQMNSEIGRFRSGSPELADENAQMNAEISRFRSGGFDVKLGSKGIKADVKVGGLKLKMPEIKVKSSKSKSSKSKKMAAQMPPPPMPMPMPMPMVQKATGVFIPFGKHIERDPTISYFLSTGFQECMVCSSVIEEGYKYGPSFYDLCGLMAPEMQEMCRAQQKVLQSCPEFTNDWCYQDLGGTQALRSPCPAHLKCHYCLGMNPLHCVNVKDEISGKLLKP